MTNDLRVSLRQLKKSPGFAVTAIVTLALGIGANAVVFGVMNALVLRPLNVPRAQNLYTVQRLQYPSQSYLDYVDLRDRNRTFESMVTFEIVGPVAVDAGGYAATAWPYMVDNLLELSHGSRALSGDEICLAAKVSRVQTGEVG